MNGNGNACDRHASCGVNESGYACDVRDERERDYADAAVRECSALVQDKRERERKRTSITHAHACAQSCIRALLSQNYVRRMRLHVQHKIRKRNHANKYAIHAKCGEIVTFYKSNQELYCH